MNADQVSDAAELLAAIHGEEEKNFLGTITTSFPDSHDSLGDLLHDGVLAVTNRPQDVVGKIGLDVDNFGLE